MFEKMSICINGKETEINTSEIANYIISGLNDIIAENVDEVLEGMSESAEKEMLTTLLFNAVKHSIARKLEG